MVRLCMLLWLLLPCCLEAAAHEGPALRRSISPDSPAWIIHIDVWNYADPQKIIDMVPEDVRPYVIFNIATSSSDEKSANGPAIYDSWMKVCAQNRVWTMIQCASGAYNRMPDDGSTKAYEQYFIDYPNFLGFNFAEQFWGFGDEGCVDFPTRLQLFADLMPICHKYGGYLAVSFCDSYYSSAKMPMAYLKRNSQMRNFLASDPEHFLCFEKYTLKKNFLDIESNCLGQWLGGYAGQYGIRFDGSGWLTADDVTDQTKGASDFVRAAGAIPIAEHFMLTGETMMDGPELTWKECSQETSTTTADGYTRRNWGWFPQFNNISLDLFRKVLDGTIRIPTREEVINRTKVCIVNDISQNLTSEGEHDSYITPETLFDGLYRSSTDVGGVSNHWIANRWWLKTTGRYPTIPQTYAAVSGMTAFKKSEFNKTTFDNWMKNNFPEEYSGDIYAGRHENGWVTYNPYQYDETTESGYRVCSTSTTRATGTIPFQYNTCTSIELNYAPYSMGIIKEYNNKVDLYLTNYHTSGTISEDVIKINGASSQPTVTWNDRGSHTASTVTTSWSGGVYTITVKHNGPLDIAVSCAGNASGRETSYTTANIIEPDAPEEYSGRLQYEAEVADYKSTTINKTGYNKGRDDYYGQGFAELNSKQGALRFSVTVPQTGYYMLTTRYQADGASQATVDNDNRMELLQSSEWLTATDIIRLAEGTNNIVIKNTGNAKVYVDCIMLDEIPCETFAPDENGDFYVTPSNLIPVGSVSFDAETGVVTLAKGNGSLGSFKVFFDHADFSKVESIKVTYDGDGDIFSYLVISDTNGNSVNPSGSQGGFWSSKYNLNYANYQTVDASSDVCKMEWSAKAPSDEPATMVIKSIHIKVPAATGITNVSEDDNKNGLCSVYDLNGRKVGTFNVQSSTFNVPKGIHIVKMSDGTTKKIIF